MTLTHKKVFVILSAVLSLLIVTFLVLSLLGRYSKTYNNILDKDAFEQLRTRITANDIERIHISQPRTNGLTEIVNTNTFDIFDSMTYVESAWNSSEIDWLYRVDVYTANNSNEIAFGNIGTDKFWVYYKERYFVVSVPALLSLATTVQG